MGVRFGVAKIAFVTRSADVPGASVRVDRRALPAGLLIARPQVPASVKGLLHLAVVGFLIQSVYFGLAYLGMSLGVSAGTAAVIASLQPLVVALAAPFVSDERVALRHWAGFALGAAAALLVVTARDGFDASLDTGVWLCVGSAIGMAGGPLPAPLIPSRRTPSP